MLLGVSRTAPPIVLAPEERATLATWIRGRSLSYRKVVRAKIVTMAADGVPSQDIATALNVSSTTVQLWREWFLALSVEGLEQDAPRPDRTQPGLPMKPGRCGTRTHDYKRNGTTTLFAALSMLDGKVIGDCMPRHRHQEFLRFLKTIDGVTPTELDLHLIVDNYGTHKHPRVKRWLHRHPRFHLHFIPTSSSWLNMVERWFRELTDKR